jgi:hypothetical protein
MLTNGKWNGYSFSYSQRVEDKASHPQLNLVPIFHITIIIAYCGHCKKYNRQKGMPHISWFELISPFEKTTLLAIKNNRQSSSGA